MSSMSLKGGGSSQKRRRNLIFYGRLFIAVVAILYAMFPVIWIISASFNPAGSLSSQKLIPSNASLENYRELLDDPLHPFLRWMWNSFKIATISSILAVAVTTLSAYAFSRFRFRGRRSLMVTILLIQVFPNTLMMVALFLTLQAIGTYIPSMGLNSHGGLILIYLGGAMGINVWLMKGFFDSIPGDIDESAMVDGASHWQAFRYLILPLVRPILAVVGILTFIGNYSEFVLARVMLQSNEQFTLMVGLYLFVSEQFSKQWGVFAAGGLIGGIPIVVLYLLLQDQIVGGLTQGSVKG
jgi:arabinogalactan oligomer / maltooligosaccharide transport system permease protein